MKQDDVIGCGVITVVIIAIVLSINVSIFVGVLFFFGVGGLIKNAPEIYDYLKKQKGPFFIDPRDGKKYRTVKIGKQVWMAQNLNYEAEGSKCYNNDSAKAKKYGRLYDWETAMKACPEGWHLPSDAEWDELINYAYSHGLKASSGWNNDAFTGNSANGSDVYGFSALPGGKGEGFGGFSSIGDEGNWWSSSSRCWYMFGNMGFESGLGSGKLCSVRCVQDQGNET